MRRYDILNNKKCFLSGATGGIGREIAKELAERSCDLFLTSRNNSSLEILSSEIGQLNQTIKIGWLGADLKQIDEIKKVADSASTFLGGVDILINCAAIFEVKPLTETTLMDFENCININLRSAFIFSKIFSKFMKRSGWGRIVNIGSSSSYQGAINTSIYCMTKHGLLGFSRALRQELAYNNIRVYCISPSATKTEMGRKIVGQNYGTFLNPKEIAEMISFVISSDDQGILDELRINRMIINS